MPVHYNAATQTARMTATLGQIDASATEATLEIGPTGMATVLVEIELDKPSFSVSGTPAVLTMLGVPLSGDATATGTAGEARIKDGAGVSVVTGLTVTATGGGGDVTLNSVAISNGQTVTLTQGTITHAA